MESYTQFGIPLVIICAGLFLSFKLLVQKDYGMLKNIRSPKPKNAELFCRNAGILSLVFSLVIILEAFISARFPLIGYIIESCTIVAYLVIYKIIDNKYG